MPIKQLPIPPPAPDSHHSMILDYFFFGFRLLYVSHVGEGNGNPLQCSCLENSMDRGAWWASIYGVAQSRT